LDKAGKIYHFDRDYGLTRPQFGDVILYQVGELYSEVGFSNGSHQQWCYEITYIESGVGTILSNGRSCEVHAGDVIVTGRDSVHEITSESDGRLRFLYLGFDLTDEVKKQPQMAEILDFFDTTKDVCISDRFGVGDLMHKLLQEFYSEYTGFDEAVAAYLKLIVMMTYRNANPTMRQGRLGYDTEESIGATVYRVIRYVDDHLYAIDSIRSIANELNYNYSYLSYMFKKHTGITLQKYITNKKMEHAQSMLLERGQSIAQVATILGYKNTQSFSKAFNNVFNMSPSVFMKQQKKEETSL